MHKLTWYRQKRFDGGIRTAIDVDDTTLFHQFENKSTEPDPALLWYVDLRCEGARLPTTPSEVRSWLLEQAAVICAAFKSVAQEFRAGMDVDVWPLQRKVPGLPDRIRGTIVCSMVQRLEGLDLANTLVDIAERWEERIRNILPTELSRSR